MPSSHASGVPSACGHLLFAEITRVAFSVEADKALDPMHVGLLSAQTVVLAANGISDLIEQPGWAGSTGFRNPIYHGAYRIPDIFYGDDRVTL